MKYFSILLTVILMLAIPSIALAQSPLLSTTPEPTLTLTVVPEPTIAPTVVSEPTPAPTVTPESPATPDDIASDITGLVDQVALGGLASLLVMVFTYFNIAPDGWGGRVYFGTGVFVFVVSLTQSANDAAYVFNVLRELSSLITLLFGGIGTNVGLRYLKMLPGRRGS